MDTRRHKDTKARSFLIKNLSVFVSSCLCVCLVSFTASAQDLRIVNAKLEGRSTKNVVQDVKQIVGTLSDPAWIAYRVPLVDGEHTMCCSGGSGWQNGTCCGACELERTSGWTTSTTQTIPAGGPIRLEHQFFWVLMRAADRRVQKVRMFSENCPLDAGGVRVIAFGDADAAQSVQLLNDLLHSDLPAGSTQGKLGETVGVIAMHHTPAAVEMLLRLARNDSNSSIRSQALFWVAQRAGRDAEATITDAIRNDPETEVKKRAVFALGQLPKDRGIPLLVDVARTNANPVVRKQAMFWLGQSNDPRALAFFEEILSKK